MSASTLIGMTIVVHLEQATEGLITPAILDTIDPSASPNVIMWKLLDQYLFLNIVPNNFTAGTGWKFWRDHGTKPGLG